MSGLLFYGAAIRFAVPDKIFGLTLFLDFIDRCTPMGLLHLPQAAQPHWAKFSLATSSLPTILGQLLPCVSYRKLLDKTLVCQRLLGFACCALR